MDASKSAAPTHCSKCGKQIKGVVVYYRIGEVGAYHYECLHCEEDAKNGWALYSRISQLTDRVTELEDTLLERGAMEDPPCFICGYSGPGYYQPEKHPCAERHHKLRK